MKQLTQEDLKFIQEWIITPEKEREPKSQAAVARHLGFTEKTISVTIQKLEVVDGDEEVRRFKKKLYQDAMKPNAKEEAKKTYARSKGLLIDRMEQIIKVVNADEIAKRNLEADRQLREGGYRVEEVPEEPTLLSE